MNDIMMFLQNASVVQPLIAELHLWKIVRDTLSAYFRVILAGSAFPRVPLS
jgi:hypothetical protein